jgi:CHAT domain-containing protein
MLSTKRRKLKTEELLTILSIYFFLTVVIAVSCVQKTASTASEPAAQNLKVQSLTTVTPPDPKYSEAQQERARAEALRADSTEASLRQAIDQYDKAALLWVSISDFADASEATGKSGDVCFLISEYKQALDRYTKAEVLAEKTNDWLIQARALSQMGRVQSYLGNNTLAESQLTKAIHFFEQHEANRTISAANGYGEALSNLAEVNYSKGNFVQASNQFESALKVLHGDPTTEAKVHLFKAYIAGSIGETEKAAGEITWAREIYHEINDKRGEGLTLTVMGTWHSSKNQDRALELHREAIEIFRAIGDRYSEATALNGIGQVYWYLHDYANAIAYFTRALTIFQSIGALDAVAGTTGAIAEAHYRNNDKDQALAYFGRSLALSRTAGKVRTEAYALGAIAKIYGDQRRDELALKQYQKIQTVYKRIGDLRGQAMALNAESEFFLQIGEKQKALDLSRQALPLGEKIGDNEILLATLYNLARANQALGFHEVALSVIEQSLHLIEDMRVNVRSPEFRSSYFSGVKRHYDLCIDILMQLDRLRPGDGAATKAFFVSEKSRARLLIDLLSESRANIREGAAKELVERERRLRGFLQRQAEYQLDLSLSGKDSTEITEVADQIAQLRSDYQAVQAELREQNPRLFSFEQFAPVDLQRIQKELQGSDTMLLEYALGDERSYLWAVTSSSVEHYELPARKVIEDAARELYKTITARQGSDDQSENDYQANIAAAENHYSEQASNLSRMLLGPVIEKLGSRRIVVVTDGALQYIPFEALPTRFGQPTGPVEASTNFLIATNEVVVLPSASILIAIRSAQNHKSPDKLVAIIADPVFSSSDDRVPQEASRPAVAKAAADQNPEQTEQQTVNKLRLPRLAHASEEADAISTAAPWGTTLVAKGFDASRETVMSSEVSRAQIVHFATHGFLDTEHPELSALVLTMTDRNGAKTDGLMPLPDIYTLDLSAELIVLSACQTALGKDIQGEGLVGLTHSFMSAGAKSVVASLWKVDDRATAALMADFYEGMLQKGMTPAAALRSAKLKMMSRKQWSAPYYWAGFVLQGEYTNHIAVDRYSWLRPGLILLVVLILIATALLVFQKRRRQIRLAQFTQTEPYE